MAYELHPLCTLFPRLTGAEFDALRDDIKANGLRSPIVLHEGMILDGGNRYRACVEAGVEPAFVEFGGGNAVSFVLSANLHRRHMSAGQQAAIVASAQDWAKAHSHGGARKGDQGARLHLETVDDRAKASGASVRTQKMADKVAKVSPDLAKEVAQGTVSLPAAIEKIEGKRPGARPKAPVVPIRPDEPEPNPEDFGPSAEELAEAEIELRLQRESYDRILGADDKAAALDAEVKRLHSLLKVEIGQKNRFMNEANEWKRRALNAERKLKAAA